MEKSKFDRLREAIEDSRQTLQSFREHRHEAIQQYVGIHYGQQEGREKVPVNLIELALSVFSRRLVAAAPRVMVGTRYPKLVPTATNLGLAMNQLAKEINLADTLSRWVKDALLQPYGVIKVGICDYDQEVEIDGYTHDYGQPFADNVDFDDYVVDMCARRADQITFEGNRFRVPLEWAKENRNYDADARERLKPHERIALNEQGDERAEAIGTDRTTHDEYIDFVELWEIWLPMENRIVTMEADQGAQSTSSAKRPLQVREWEGPEQGPFRKLWFDDVPGNLMPLPPVATWTDLHTLTNQLYRKLGRQALRQKTIYGVHSAGKPDGDRIVRANDGDVITVDHPEKIATMQFPGADQVNMAFMIGAKDLFSYMAGNLDALGGLSSQAETLGQEELLSRSSSAKVDNMQASVIKATTLLLYDLGLYIWTDPLIEMPLTKRVEGTDIEIPITWTPEMCEGDFIQYNLEIEPFSMQPKSPSQRLQGLMQIVQGVLLPAMPMMQQAGAGVNWEELVRLIGEYGDLRDLSRIVTFAEPSSPPGEPIDASAPYKSPVTKRTYERVNRPAGTRQGKDQALMQTLLGKMPQPAEMAGLNRPG